MAKHKDGWTKARRAAHQSKRAKEIQSNAPHEQRFKRGLEIIGIQDFKWADDQAPGMHPDPIPAAPPPDHAPPSGAIRSTGEVDFGGALGALKGGVRVARKEWIGKGMFLFFVEDWRPMRWSNRVMPLLGQTLGFIAMNTADGYIVPWAGTQTDILANDWVIV